MSATLQIALYLTIFGAITAAPDKSKETATVSPGPSPSNGHSNMLQKLRQMLSKSAQEEHKNLKKVYLTNHSITCNDGSQAGFYLRKSPASKKWIVFLEGGWYCYDEASCKNRWLKLRHLMTSTQWEETRDVGGILSANPEENPYWWNANHVFVPYCTSDSWSGTKSTPTDLFSFMGSEIVTQVVRDLVPLGLENASSLFLAGSSAGGTGVLLNLDRIHNLVKNELKLTRVIVRGVSDSGWFMDRAPYTLNVSISPIDAVKNGMTFWKARLPTNCVAKYPNEPWRCYFGYRLYPTLKTPLFIFQWIFDEAQMTADNVGAPVTRSQWNYIHSMGELLLKTFDNVTAVFAPSCISHSVLTKRDWQLVKIDHISLPQSLHCWERNTGRHAPIDDNSQAPRNRTCGGGGGGGGGGGKLGRYFAQQRNNTKKVNKEENQMTSVGHSVGNESPKHRALNNDPDDNREEKRKRRRRLKQKGNRRDKNRDGPVRISERQARRKERRRLNAMNLGISDATDLNGMRPQRSSAHGRKRNCGKNCSFRLIERCTWPQCNHSCPRLHNPFTGAEMDFIELLKSFGLDMKSMAQALGVDEQTLDNMDQNELLNWLT